MLSDPSFCTDGFVGISVVADGTLRFSSTFLSGVVGEESEGSTIGVEAAGTIGISRAHSTGNSDVKI